MKWIAAAGAVLLCWLGISGVASGAGLVRVTPPGFLDTDPSFLTSPPGDSRVFIAERGDSGSHVAQVRLIKDGVPVEQPFLSIGNVNLVSERGLMSIAFAPDYATSGLLYAFYTANGGDALDPGGAVGDIRIVEYRRSGSDPDLADPSTARLVMKIPHGAGNHNGGWMEFGPDGMLYFSIGDDANSSNAQTLSNLLGKIIRIDPKDPAGPEAYTIPGDNPFVGTGGARGEIYAYGLRNPYRGSFAPDGRLTIADVGQNTWEEINSGDLRGKNLGWPSCEGVCSTPNPAFTDPFFTYRQDGADGFGGGCAVVGGHVVEDPGLTGLTGRYIYADFCGEDGRIRSLNLDTPGGGFANTGLTTFANVIAFGQDWLGCSYVLTQSDVFRIVGEEGDPAGCPIPPPLPPPPPGEEIEYTSFIPNRAVMAKRLNVGALCTVSCSAVASGSVKISRNKFRRRPATFYLKAVSQNLPTGARGTLALQIPLRRVKAMKKAARNGSRVTARIKVTMTGADGSGGSGAKTTRLVRPKRR